MIAMYCAKMWPEIDSFNVCFHDYYILYVMYIFENAFTHPTSSESSCVRKTRECALKFGILLKTHRWRVDFVRTIVSRVYTSLRRKVHAQSR